MVGRKKRQELSGVDYLLGVAAKARDNSQPFSDEFATMVMEAFSPGEPLLLAEMTAKRPLRPHEASPTAIVVEAAEMALARGDQEALREVLRVGCSMLAKWPAWLLSRNDGHPDFELKD